MLETQDFIVRPSQKLQGIVRIPGDKSISHRAIMLCALSNGVSAIENFLMGKDTLAIVYALQSMGVTIELFGEGSVLVYGVGTNGLSPPSWPIHCNNSGTSMRLLAGILSAQAFNTELTGDQSLLRRPMARIVEPLTQMGAKITMHPNGTAPLKIIGGQQLHGIRYSMPVASAQVKSSLLLAGLYASGVTEIIEPLPTRDHTERILKAFGYSIQYRGNAISLVGGHKLTATSITIPGDLSSAAFLIVGALIAKGSEIVLREVGINPTRIGIINILRMMGANIRFENEKDDGIELVADIRVRYAKLRGIDIPLSQVSLAIDEFPALFIAAACADGVTTLRNAKELRVKESDRIAVMAEGLQKLSISVTVAPDGLQIEGSQFSGGEVNSYGDHRVAMAFAMAGLRATESIHICDCANVATSFPNFVTLCKSVGLNLNSAVDVNCGI